MQGQEREGSKCQDCGNQAKRDCSYRRCRTCCKNKGFECQTHIKSTWVPVDRRQQMEKQPSPTIYPHHLREEDMPRKHKHNIPYDSSGLEEFKFPAATNSMAIFRCVEVRSMDDAVNEIAYQTSVKIGGRIFSGLLYDQGPDHQSFYTSRGDTSTRTLNASSQTHDGASATMAPLLLASHDDEPSFPPPYPFPSAPFRSGMPYFSQPRP